MFTVGVGDKPHTTERQSQDEKYKWSHKHQIPDYDDYGQDGYRLIGEDHAISQGVADGNIAIYGHDCQHHRLQASEYVNGVHLRDTSTKINVPEIEPENAQHLGDGGCGQAKVSAGQHGQEVKHGLVEDLFSLDHKEDGEVAQEGD